MQAQQNYADLLNCQAAHTWAGLDMARLNEPSQDLFELFSITTGLYHASLQCASINACKQI